MTIRELDSVILERGLPEHGLAKGDLGAVVHVYAPDTFEVEFVRISGSTRALVQLRVADIRPALPHDSV
jgi:hypothetical protein